MIKYKNFLMQKTNNEEIKICYRIHIHFIIQETFLKLNF